MTAPLKWHGGKQGEMAKWILGHAPEHVHYVEPFAGGLGVLLAKDPGASEVVNDKFGDLVNFWRVLRDTKLFESFARAATMTPVSQQEWTDSEAGRLSGEPPSKPCVASALAFFVRMRQSRQGVGDSFNTLSRNRTRRGMNEQASAWLSAVDSLPEIHARLRSVVILCDDALKVIRQQDGPNTFFYCDPPYLQETRASPNIYTYEMTKEEHLDLLDALSTIEGKFILSGYPSEMYQEAERLCGWRRVERVVAKHSSNKATKDKATECLWMNF